jgi:hypothetical protein
MSNLNVIFQIDNKFTISRIEGWGYVTHYVEFDEQYLSLIEKKYKPGEGEGASCTTLYTFEIKSNEKIPILEITFRSEYGGNNKYYENYSIDFKKQIVETSYQKPKTEN